MERNHAFSGGHVSADGILAGETMDSRLRLFGSLALLGTSRRTPSFSESDFPAGTLIRDLADHADGSPDAVARVMLCGAGALFVCGRAGYEPAADEKTADFSELCPEETRPLLPDHAPVTDMLGEIFRTGALRLQREALSHLERRGMVLAHALLVPALSMGRSTPVLRPLLARTIGTRGLWLASLNPDWRMFADSFEGEPDMEAWEHGRPMQRQAFFLSVRTKEPARARELFEKDLSTMDASERSTLLGLFGHGLSGDDEDLLERLLRRDRSREVRKTAALLLSLLPESRYLARMEARLAGCLQAFMNAPEPSVLSGLKRLAAAVTGKGSGGIDFVTPPEAYDASWAEDLISEKSPFVQFGPRAGWLYQMASSVPLSWWTKFTGRTPEELLELSEHSEWKKPLQAAWGDAELRFGDRDWARAMLKFMKKGGAWPCTSSAGLDRFHLAGLLGSGEREKAWEELLSPDTLVDFLEDVRRRQELDYRMSPSLADKALSVLKARLSSAKSRDYALSYVIGELAMLIPSEKLEKARQLSADLPDSSQNGEIVDRFSAVVLQRRAMNEYFS